MKRKYYMRGLGIGIILTTLIFSLTNTKEKLSDAEIMDRARTLGMVTQDENDKALEQVLDEIKPTVASEQPSATPGVEPTATPTEVPVEPTATPTAAPTPIPTPKPTVTPTKAPAEPAADTTQANGDEVSFTIKSGMSSGQVALLLVEVGLIEEDADFNQYIVDKGKASVIRVGTYSLPKGASYADIVNAITTK